MKIKMLPNWCKKLGLVVFILSMVISLTYVENRGDFIRGWNDGRNQTRSKDKSSIDDSFSVSEIKTLKLKPLLFEKMFGSNSLHFIEILILLSMIVYMLAKEKVEDDYINKLRLESYQLTAVLALVSSVVLYSFYGNLRLRLNLLISLFLLFYLITFTIKKRIY